MLLLFEILDCFFEDKGKNLRKIKPGVIYILIIPQFIEYSSKIRLIKCCKFIFLDTNFALLPFYISINWVLSRMLKSLAGCLRELSASDFYSFFFFHFGFLWYSSFVISFPRFSSGFSGQPKFPCLDIPRTIIKYNYIN